MAWEDIEATSDSWSAIPGAGKIYAQSQTGDYMETQDGELVETQESLGTVWADIT